MYPACAAITVSASTMQSLYVRITMFHKLVDQLVVGEDERLKTIQHLMTSPASNVIHVEDHAWDHEASLTLRSSTL